MLEWRSALAGAGGPAPGDGPADDYAPCTLCEVTGWSLCHVAGWPDSVALLEGTLGEVSGVRVPARTGRFAGDGPRHILRTGPEHFLVLDDEGAALSDLLARRIAVDMGVVVDLTAARVRLALRGPKARDLLAKGIAIDLHPQIFDVGNAAMVGLDHVPVVLWRAGLDHYELLVPHTYGVANLHWLVDAGKEFAIQWRSA